MPSSSARTRSVSASRGIGCSVGELPGLDETLAGGDGEVLAGVADVGAGLLVEGASGGRAAAERWEVPVAALGEVITVGVPAVLGAANAACTAVLSSCVAISAAAASTCCSGAGEVGVGAAVLGIELAAGVAVGAGDVVGAGRGARVLSAVGRGVGAVGAAADVGTDGAGRTAGIDVVAVGVGDLVTSGATTAGAGLAEAVGALGAGVGALGIAPAVVVEVALGAAGVKVGCSAAGFGAALGVLLGDGVLLGRAGAVVSAAGGVAVGVGVGVALAAQAATAARSASATIAVIRSRACSSCASRFAGLKGLVVGVPLADVANRCVGVIVTV